MEVILLELKKEVLNKMNKSLKALLIGGMFTGAILAGNINKTYESGCETYQGYSNIESGRVYVFDSKPIGLRETRGPKYGALGESSLKDSLEMGKDYCFELEKSSIPGSFAKIVSIDKE